MIRPTAEYAAVVWHSMLTQEENKHLKKQQVQALKRTLELVSELKKCEKNPEWNC